MTVSPINGALRTSWCCFDLMGYGSLAIISSGLVIAILNFVCVRMVTLYGSLWSGIVLGDGASAS